MPSGCSRSRKRSRRCAGLPRSRRGQRGEPAAAALQRAARPIPARRYTANIHAGAVESAGVACVRAGSAFTPVQSAGRPQGQRRRRRQLHHHHPLRPAHRRAARLHARDLSLGAARRRHLGARGVARRARGRRACSACSAPACRPCPNCRAICAVRPIKRVKVFSPNPAHRAAFVAADGGRDIRDGRGRRSARGGARRACHRLRHQLEGAGAQRRMARARADGRHHRQFRRHQRPPRGRRDDLRARAARSSSTTGTASRPTARSSCRGRSPRAW